MTYDPSDFIEGLGQMREMWLERQIHLNGPYDKDWGFMMSQPDPAGLQPSYYLGNRWDPASNHEMLIKSAWTTRLQGIFQIMDANLRLIPALNFPEMVWSLSFRQGNGQADHILSLLDLDTSVTYLTTLGTTAYRLRTLFKNTQTLPVATDLPRHKVGRIIYRATCKADVIHLRSAITGQDPNMVHRRDYARIETRGVDPQP